MEPDRGDGRAPGTEETLDEHERLHSKPFPESQSGPTGARSTSIYKTASEPETTGGPLRVLVLRLTEIEVLAVRGRA
jgi:hypothetical protein